MDFIRRKPVSSAADLTLSLRVLTMHVNQGLSEEDPAPFYPLMIAIFDGQYFHRPIISPGLCQEDYDTMLEELAEILSDADFRPEHIEVDSEHASYFLMDFCNELGIELIEFESIPEIDDFFDHMEEDMFDPAAIIQQIHEIAAEHPEVRDIVDQFMEAHQGEELNPQLLAELFSKIIPQEE